MRVTTTIEQLKAHYAESTDLFKTVLNARSPFEASLALDILRETVPERVLVATVNLREALAALPEYPTRMAVDELTLARVAGLRKDRMTWRKDLDTASLVITTGGNFCFDLIIDTGEENLFWSAIPRGADMVNPAVLDELMERPGLLAAVVELVGDMGLPFNPRMHLSLEDWSLDHVQDLVEDLKSLF
ncbi:MAG: hypothetical protein Kow0067_12250 [Coriobacteriia bacterium]